MTSIKKKNVIYKKIITAKIPAEKTSYIMTSDTYRNLVTKLVELARLNIIIIILQTTKIISITFF